MPEEVKPKSTLKTNVKFEKEVELVKWIAPARPFKKRNREFYITLIAISAIVGLVLFLVEGWMPVILIVSLVFLFYVMNTVEPENIEYTITSAGVYVAGKKTNWENFTRFWFSRRFDNKLLILETHSLPGRMELVVTNTEKQIRDTLLKYIPEEETSPSFLDKSANWFSKKLPQ